MGCCLCWSISILAGLGIIILALKLYFKLRIRKNGSYVCLVGKTVIITGANTGIGYTTALDLAKRGAKVILACRNEDKAKEARRNIVRATQNPNVFYKLVDFTSFKSVRAFAKEINETEERIDILINNAGAVFLGDHFTEDGAQITLQVNHLSGFLLTHLLLDKIKQSTPSRIVNISSLSASHAKLDLDTINEFPRNRYFSDYTTYANSKLLNILFTVELAKKLGDVDVTVNVVHPGGVRTDALRNLPRLVRTMSALNPSFMSAEDGAQTTIYVATSNDVRNVTGKLFDNCKEIELYKTARDPDLAPRSWKECEKLVKLSDSEKIK